MVGGRKLIILDIQSSGRIAPWVRDIDWLNSGINTLIRDICIEWHVVAAVSVLISGVQALLVAS